jgi:hypothetical protein
MSGSILKLVYIRSCVYRLICVCYLIQYIYVCAFGGTIIVYICIMGGSCIIYPYLPTLNIAITISVWNYVRVFYTARACHIPRRWFTYSLRCDVVQFGTQVSTFHGTCCLRLCDPSAVRDRYQTTRCHMAGHGNLRTGVRTSDLTIVLCFSGRVKGIVDVSALFSEESGSEFLLVSLIQFCDSF